MESEVEGGALHGDCLLGWRVIDGSTRHDAHAQVEFTGPGRCCAVVHGAQ